MLNIKLNIYYVVAGVTLIIIVLIIAFFSHFRAKSEAVSCHATLSIVDRNRTLSFYMDMSFDQGDGFITLVGRDSESNAVLRLRKTFRYQLKKNNVMVMYNDKSIMNCSNPEAVKTFKKYLPAFFLSSRSDMKMLTRVVKSRDDLLIFMVVDTPLFVCEVR